MIDITMKNTYTLVSWEGRKNAVVALYYDLLPYHLDFARVYRLYRDDVTLYHGNSARGCHPDLQLSLGPWDAGCVTIYSGTIGTWCFPCLCDN